MRLTNHWLGLALGSMSYQLADFIDLDSTTQAQTAIKLLKCPENTLVTQATNDTRVGLAHVAGLDITA